MKNVYLLLLCLFISNTLLSQNEDIENIRENLSASFGKCRVCLQETGNLERLPEFRKTYEQLSDVLRENNYDAVRDLEDEYRALRQCAMNCKAGSSSAQTNSERIKPDDSGTGVDWERLQTDGAVTEYYEVQPILENELIAGLKGNYFLVDFKNAYHKQKFLFKAGEYTYKQLDTVAGKSVQQFMRQIVMPLLKDNNISRIGLYCKGSADKAGHSTFKREWDSDPRYQFTSAEFLQANGAQYLYSPKVQQLSKTFGNQELPLYRALYMQKLLKDRAGNKPIEFYILEGEVTNLVTPSDRNVLVLLFVKEK